MKKLLILVWLISLLITPAYAQDAPHNVTNTIACTDCHPGGKLPQDDSVCLQCHINATGGGYSKNTAPKVATHSSVTTESIKYGTWSVMCIDCHGIHHDQRPTYGPATYLGTGKITSVTDNGITTTFGYNSFAVTSPNRSAWADYTKWGAKTGNERGLVIYPNTSDPSISFEIISATANTIIVKGLISAFCPLPPAVCTPSTIVAPGNTFTLTYGQNVEGNLQYSTTRNPSATVPVKFFDKTGPNSFADGNTTYDGVCEVCHTQTTHFRNNGEGLDPNHTNIGSGIPGTNCISCHTHTEGFKASCNACHGYPPIVNSATSPDGLVWILPVTGSTTAGAHNLHVNTKSYQCDTCHYQNITQNKHNKDPRVITLGFYMFDGAVQGGSYNGQTTVDYNTTTTTPPTTVTKTGLKQCNNIYCHSSGQSANGTSATPVYAPTPPNWTGTALCGSCHATTALATGSHTAHLAASTNCGLCHTGASATAYNSANHVNGLIDVAAVGYTAGGAPGNGYGTCSATSCHANVYGAGFATTSTWGSTGNGCSTCHSIAIAASGPNTGSHAKHNVTDCSKCHAGATNNITTPTLNHVDGNIDVIGGYPPNVTKHAAGTYTGICSAATCHDNGKGVPAATPIWGVAAPACTACHAAAPATNSHTKHLSGISSMFAANAVCGDCHGTAVQGGPANVDHLDNNIDVYNTTSGDLGYPQNKIKGSALASCTTSYCHSNGPKLNFKSATWGGTSTGCNFCHGFPPATTIHTGLTATTCINCHTHVNSTGTGFTNPALHGNHIVEGGDCISCHSVQQGNRAPVAGQFSSNSHHIQGVTLTNAHCYQCHWEADSNGSMTEYHTGFAQSGAPVNLVIYGTGTRPATYTVGTTAVEYTAGATPPPSTVPGVVKVVDTWKQLSTSGSGSSRTASFTAGAGTVGNRMVMIGMAWEDSHSSGCNPSSIAGNYGGQTITSINKANSSNNREGQWMGYVREAGIAMKSNNTITLIFSGCTPDLTPTISAATYEGVDQASAPSSAIASGTTGSAFSWGGLPVVKDGYAMYNVNADGISSFTPPANYIERYDAAASSNFRMSGGDKAISADGTESQTVKGNTSSSRWALVAVSVKPSAVSLPGGREIEKINQHCLGCHSAQNDATQPFGDGKTPKQYAWDGTSVAERYSQTGTTPWGKYSGANVTPKNTQTKAFSAHGNAANNQRGWNLTETWSNTGGTVTVACFDCHNSHGSTVDGTTTSYDGKNGTTNGGILKDTTAGKGGYAMAYKPQAGGSTLNKNAYNPGAGLCFDCHMTQNVGTTPWGYQGTFGSTQAIMGYFDTKYFGTDTFGYQQRYTYKASSTMKGGHFGASSSLAKPVNGTIGGLCTPCHDPHGVSPTLSTNQQYSVPLLKGTWMTSPYKEDAAPLATNEKRGGGKEGEYVHSDASTPNYHIDQNTFNTTWSWSSTARVTQTEDQFAGLCLKCHTKDAINKNDDKSWRSMDRIHNTVKGWADGTYSGANNNNAVHSFTCSKCHAPHNSSLNRLMVTNCLDYKHRGRVASGGIVPTKHSRRGDEGQGAGQFPGGGGGSGDEKGGSYRGPFFFGTSTSPYIRACHDNTNPDSYPANQRWNTKTPW